MVEAVVVIDAFMTLLSEIAIRYGQARNTEGRGYLIENAAPKPIEIGDSGRIPSRDIDAFDWQTERRLKTRVYLDWRWDRDAAPSVERWRSTLEEFAARRFGSEYRRACREMRSKNLAQMDGFGIDAGSHHELLAELCRRCLSCIDQKNIASLSNEVRSSHLERYRLLRKALVDEADIVEELAEMKEPHSETGARTPQHSIRERASNNAGVIDAVAVVTDVVQLITSVFRSYSEGLNDSRHRPGSRSIVPTSLVVFPPDCKSPASGEPANPSFEWQHDGKPLVAPFIPRLKAFLDEQFDESFIVACSEMRKTRPLSLDRFGVRDATSHHELLQKVVRAVVAAIESDRPVFELHRLIRSKTPDVGIEWQDRDEFVECDAKGLNRLIPLLREELARVRSQSKSPATDTATKPFDIEPHVEQPQSPPKPKRLSAVEKAGKAHEYACENLGRTPQEVEDSETFNWLRKNGLPNGDDAIHGLDGYEIPDTLKRWRDCLTGYRTLNGEKKYGTRKGGVETGSIKRKERL